MITLINSVKEEIPQFASKYEETLGNHPNSNSISGFLRQIRPTDKPKRWIYKNLILSICGICQFCLSNYLLTCLFFCNKNYKKVVTASSLPAFCKFLGGRNWPTRSSLRFHVIIELLHYPNRLTSIEKGGNPTAQGPSATYPCGRGFFVIWAPSVIML